MTDKDIEWQDAGREPKVAPNPLYPNGIDLDVSDGIKPACFVKLAYPARRVGRYVIKCRTCGWVGIISTAGRPDDPRSVTIPCLRVLQ
jgi:hypothetical protein